MERLEILLTLFVVLLPIPGFAQGTGSAVIPEKASANVTALTRRALNGDTRSELRLGIAFEFGQGVDKNLAEAMRWYRVAADRGDPIAQTNLGFFYESGVNGPANPVEAAKWYLRAAVSGFVRAQFNLGTLYLRGAGVERNEELAVHWISAAADAGCPAAIAALGNLYANGVGVRRDERKAVELSHRAQNKKDDARLCTRYGKRLMQDSSR